jgi:chromosome segregation ATPase
MAESAHVTSIDAVRSFRTALIQFGSNAEESIVMLTLEARKAIQWLQHDRAQYWPDQLRKAQNRVIQARNDLERCQLHYGSENTPSCFDQKKALEKAKHRLRVCEEKVKAVKRWINTIREELEEFHGEVAKMNNWLECDLSRATASLERMVRALDKYAADYAGLESAGEIGSSVRQDVTPLGERTDG